MPADSYLRGSLFLDVQVPFKHWGLMKHLATVRMCVCKLALLSALQEYGKAQLQLHLSSFSPPPPAHFYVPDQKGLSVCQ